MTAANLLAYFRERGVVLWADGDRLRYKAPKGILTATLHAELTGCKQEILALLCQSDVFPSVSFPSLQPTSRDGKLIEKLVREEEIDTSQLPITARRSDHDIPLSPVQKRLWLLENIHPNSPAYNIPILLRLKGKLHITILERSFNEIINRHEILRTVFTDKEGEPIQRVVKNVDFKLRQIELNKASLSNNDEEVKRLLTRELQKPFIFEKDLFLRILLIKNNRDEYLLSIVTHHLVADGWSVGIFLREISELYSAYLARREHRLGKLLIQYGDYAYWINEHSHDTKITPHLEFLKNKFKNASLVIDLPTDFPRPPVEKHHGRTYYFDIDKVHTQLLSNTAKDLGVTRFILFLTVFKILLYKYTNQTDLIVATAVSNRNRNEIENLIGNFSNNILIHTDISDEPDVRNLVRRVRDSFIEALEHQDVDFDDLVNAMDVKRDLSRNPLFQVMFVLHQGKHDELLKIPDIEVSEFHQQTGGSKFDLLLEIFDGKDELEGAIEYNSDIFREETIEQLSRHLLTLIEAIAQNLSVSLKKIDILTEKERNIVLKEWNNTEVAYPQKDLCLHQLFEEQAGRTPDQVALVFEQQKLTYGELNRRANQLAHHLRQVGVGPDVLVGLFMERSLEMVIGIYGILKAGGAYVPLDPEYPADRVAYVIEDAQVPVVLTQKHLKDRLPTNQSNVFCLDSDWHIIAKEKTENLFSVVSAENLAYVIYTSGSTGRPKGVMNEHRGIVNRLLWMQDEYSLTESDRVLQKTPFSFDVSVWEFFWPLQAGAQLVMAKPGGHRDSTYLVDTIKRYGITTLHFVPSMLQMFLEESEVESCTCIRRVICSGETLSYELQKRFFGCLEAELHNLYGPTEAAVDVTYWACRQDSEWPIVPIGRPVANTKIYILDRCMRPVPVGVTGELYIGGVQVARGYLNRPGLTAERFIPDPFSGRPGARLYRTGDLARYLPDGSIEYLGRTDFQIKIRGLRVELGEIETRLEACEGVGRCAVELREDVPGDKRLVAYYVRRTGAEVHEVNLRSRLRELLADYMVPQHFIELEQMPLTASGKVDRKALPKPATLRKAEGQYLAPRNKAEVEVAKIWQDLLGLEKVGMRDNFFELGGHSLLVLRMVSRLKKQFARPIAVVDVFQHPTVEQLAAFLVDATDEKVLFAKTFSQGIKQREALRKMRQRPAARRFNP